MALSRPLPERLFIMPVVGVVHVALLVFPEWGVRAAVETEVLKARKVPLIMGQMASEAAVVVGAMTLRSE